MHPADGAISNVFSTFLFAFTYINAKVTMVDVYKSMIKIMVWDVIFQGVK